jgi:transcriptional regulator with XRE-family HTH domain
MPARQSPTVRRRRLGMELRRLREASGLTIEQVAERLECSDSKISRIETAHVGVTPRDVRDMLELYGVTGEQRDHLVQIAREARQRGWWHAYGDTKESAYVGLEVAAASIRSYQAQIIPGLFQTTEYARAVIRALNPNLRPEEAERQHALRMARQPILTEDPPELWVVIDEAVLRRSVGERGVMAEQLHHLIEMAELSTVTLQVLPFSAGEHAGMDGAFSILSFPEPADPEVVYLENATSDLFLEHAEDIRRYSVLFDHLRAAALRPGDTSVISSILKDLL